MDRRRFIQTLALAASAPALSVPSRAADAKIGPLRTDPGQILDLPDGYSYTVVSRAGDTMDDGLRVPHAHDGMAAFEGADGRIVLVCNHELSPAEQDKSAFAGDFANQPDLSCQSSTIRVTARPLALAVQRQRFTTRKPARRSVSTLALRVRSGTAPAVRRHGVHG